MLGFARGHYLNHISFAYDRLGPDNFLEAMIAAVKDAANSSLLSIARLAAPRPQFANRLDIPSLVPDLSGVCG
jgi:hypothetical protein